MRDDSELIKLCLAAEGSPASHQDAFNALVARHYRGIYNMLYRMLGNPEDAADLTQETFLRVYSRLDSFDLGRSFLAWIRTIASNLCIDHLRRKRNPSISLDEKLASGTELADRSPALEEQVELAEDSRRVLAAVQKLPEKQRAVLVLRHVEGLKLEEIAETLKLPLGTVKTMLFRGRAAVREMVGEL